MFPLRMRRALLLVATLAALSTPPTAVHALPPPGTDPIPQPGCETQPVTGADAELVGGITVMDPPMVGYETRLSTYGVTIRLPDPNCDGHYITMHDPPASWTLVSKPAGAAATLLQITSGDVRLVTDRPGEWVVTYTACPARCRGRITIPPLSHTVVMNSAVVTEGHVNDAELRTALNQLLKDSRLQISHTSNGVPLPGNPVEYQVRWSIPAYKWSDLCEKTPPAPLCDGPREGVRTLRKYTPIYNSYLDFGAVAVAAGAPDFIPLPIPIVEKEVPTWLRVLIVGASPGSLLAAVDVDRIQLLINNINLDFNDASKWNVGIGDGGLTLGVKLQSSHPTIKCMGHYHVRAGYVWSVSENWADEMCPDFDLSQMDLSIRVLTDASGGRLGVADAQVTAQLQPTGVQSDVIDFVSGATDTAEELIAASMRNKLLEPDTQTRLGKLLTKGLRTKFPSLCRVIQASAAAGDYTLRFTTAAQPGLPCV
jgi:hypothetical protein